MFHKVINVYLINYPEEYAQLIELESEKDLEFNVISDKEYKKDNLVVADLVIYNVKHNIDKFMSLYSKYHKDDSSLLLGMERSVLKNMLRFLKSEDVTGIIPIDLTELEFKYYFGIWKSTYMAYLKSWLYESYLRAIINSTPDLVWVKDKVGSHLMVNDAFCAAVHKSHKQIQGRGHYYIWGLTPDEYAKGEYICMESEYDVMDKKCSLTFEEDVTIDGQMRHLTTVKTPLFDFDGSVMGTVGVAKDVTEILEKSRRLEELENKIMELESRDPVTKLFTRSYIENYIREHSNLFVTKLHFDKNMEAEDTLSNSRRAAFAIGVKDILLEAFPESLIGKGDMNDYYVVRPGKISELEIKVMKTVIGEAIGEYLNKINLEIPFETEIYIVSDKSNCEEIILRL